ncbi:DsbA family oxidoreductase [Marinactinospora thermotolerans]|uniref:Predicted dithiol-disulfide isomerase, DsbA family n=1 Tax=Marinactinospora thermotolerans DSM 45154 TaxID=1122192 RepID=A0A1T4PXN3_9ACTN|nr:DsbA family oxidoreductase [Marinactinospora thermotolerans]SJZ95728.1 Predicted dithiol-disulfide isomerase, DsbA family [Marinactinospora thermotolerans DSM 45154]
MKIDVYSDIACPWCYVGTRRLHRALQTWGHQAEVTYRPFQLDPTAPLRPRPLSDYLRERFGEAATQMNERLTSLGAAEGIDFRMERAQAVNTLTAHRLLHHALTDYGRPTQARLKEALLRAYFTDGVNVADHAALAALAGEAGMDRERAEAYLAGGAGLAEVTEDIDQARRIGVRAVPTFVFASTHALQGAQPVETFLQALEQIGGEHGHTPEAGCADGTCAVPSGG